MARVEIELGVGMILLRKSPQGTVSDVLITTAVGVEKFLAITSAMDEASLYLSNVADYRCAGYAHVKSHQEHLGKYFTDKGLVDKSEKMCELARTSVPHYLG
jgi:hypothetical protein